MSKISYCSIEEAWGTSYDKNNNHQTLYKSNGENNPDFNGKTLCCNGK